MSNKTEKTSQSIVTNNREDSKQNQPKRVRRSITERQTDIDATVAKMRAKFEAQVQAKMAEKTSLDYVQDIKDLKTAVTEGQYADARNIVVHLSEVLPESNMEFDGPTPEELSTPATV